MPLFDTSQTHYLGISKIAINGMKLIKNPPNFNMLLVCLSGIVSNTHRIPKIENAAGIIKFGYLGKFIKTPAPDKIPQIKVIYKNLRMLLHLCFFKHT
ncbi:hypothetical protein HMPREF3215_01312 [Staphylococcus simulans]|nr:hypothetical protein HMPREF3215_01312 [Staphylococcus simulans]